MLSWIVKCLCRQKKENIRQVVGSMKYTVCVQYSTVFKLSISGVDCLGSKTGSAAYWLCDLGGLLLYLSLPLFPHLRNGDIHSVYYYTGYWED